MATYKTFCINVSSFNSSFLSIILGHFITQFSQIISKSVKYELKNNYFTNISNDFVFEFTYL